MWPLEILDNGTKVCVNGMHGEIIKHEWCKDQHGGPIVVHTIHYTKKYSHRLGLKSIYKDIDKTQKCNYASINLLKE